MIYWFRRVYAPCHTDKSKRLILLRGLFSYSPLDGTIERTDNKTFPLFFGERRRNEGKIGKSIVKKQKSFFFYSRKSIRKRIRVKELIVSTLHSLSVSLPHTIAVV